jgi:hypothetical protein
VSLWHILDARNKCLEGEGMMHPKSIAAKIKKYIDMICIHLYKPTAPIRREPSSSTPKWIPPPACILLVNVDAANFAPRDKWALASWLAISMGPFLILVVSPLMR